MSNSRRFVYDRLRRAAMAAIGMSLLHGVVPAAAPENSFAVQNARVFDGEHVIPTATVIVQDGLILTVAADTEIPRDFRVIDGRDKTLMPGLIDSHVHVFPGAQEDALRFGVTTEMDMFSLGGNDAARAYESQRESLAQSAAADTWSALNGVTPPGGHPTQMAAEWGIQIPTLAAGADSKAFVEARIAEGSDHIKIFQDDTVIGGETRLAKFSARQLKAVIDAVHAHDLKAIVHVSAHAEAQLAFASGADMIAHVFQDHIADDALIRLAKERRAAVIATLSVLAGASGEDHASRLAADPYVKPWLSQMQKKMLAAKFSREDPQIIVRATESIRRFHAAGVPVLAGTDAPNPTTAHGPSIHQELSLLVDAGLTPAAALNAATAAPARAFGLSDRGRIAPGMRADLILVDGDPTSDITHSRRIAAIWKNGYAVNRAPPEP